MIDTELVTLQIRTPKIGWNMEKKRGVERELVREKNMLFLFII